MEEKKKLTRDENFLLGWIPPSASRKTLRFFRNSSSNLLTAKEMQKRAR